jgi:hypothetical protein
VCGGIRHAPSAAGGTKSAMCATKEVLDDRDLKRD